MSDSDPFEEYHKLYRDIAFGYSRVLDKDETPVFIKHLKELEKEYSYQKHQINIEVAEKKGLKREEEAIKFLAEQDIWLDSDEKRIEDIKDELSGLEATLSKLIIKKQKEGIKPKITNLRVELLDLSQRRSEALGLTAEGFANKKQTEDTILLTFFKNEDLSEALYSKEEFDLLSDLRVNELTRLYFETIFDNFNPNNIKRISICPFYMSLFNVCNDNIYNFYGKSVMQLTHLQVAVFTMAKYYKKLMENCKAAPEDYHKSPESLIEWYEGQNSLRNVESGKQGGDGGGRSIIGANKEELKTLENEGEEIVDVSKAIEESGGKMDFDEILKMHGI